MYTWSACCSDGKIRLLQLLLPKLDKEDRSSSSSECGNLTASFNRLFSDCNWCIYRMASCSKSALLKLIVLCSEGGIAFDSSENKLFYALLRIRSSSIQDSLAFYVHTMRSLLRLSTLLCVFLRCMIRCIAVSLSTLFLLSILLPFTTKDWLLNGTVAGDVGSSVFSLICSTVEPYLLSNNRCMSCVSYMMSLSWKGYCDLLSYIVEDCLLLVL